MPLILSPSLHSGARLDLINVGRNPSTVILPGLCQQQRVTVIVLGQGSPEGLDAVVGESGLAHVGPEKSKDPGPTS